MARAGAAVVLAFAVCCLLVATAPARHPADLPPRVLDAVDREAPAEALLAKPVAVSGAEDRDAKALAVPEEGAVDTTWRDEGRSLLCLLFGCGGEPADAGGELAGWGSSDEPAELDGQASPAGTAEVEDEEGGDVEEKRPYDSDCDSDSDCEFDSDSDDEDEGSFLGWFWRLAHGHGF